ncbi:M56 family metallopeptidase [Dokdonia pacifica]|uniref:BlaR1 peptidase M56 n=1 Tax=Dokdonia pacifica TaxID=1627892 RepID=A0A239B3S6_9FLAO|nr:M56 family metallopeptidase [Dokdonia pacifica]SNS02231.1 BlaR1 peptidase M56 [Dokdonia pacifica]
MEPFIYIIKSITILSIFYIIYRIVLQKDTFFTANRHYLLAGIVAALVFPFIEYTKIIYKDIPIITTTVEDSPMVMVTETVLQSPSEPLVINWWQIALIVYTVGVCIMMVRLCIQLISLHKLISSYPKTYSDGYTYVQITDKSITPFSFFKTICYNPNLHNSKELTMILAHEKIHVRQRHTIDVLLTQCLLAIQWLNPLAWLYKKSLEQNLEFIADSGAIQEVPSSKEYQHTLVKVSSTIVQPALTNNFYHSLIKKRIVMLNKQTSRKRNLWKLGLVLPILAIFMYSFNVNEVIEYREVPNTPENAIEPSSERISILEEEVPLTKNNDNTNDSVANNKAIATPNEQKQFTITNTTTDAYLKSIEAHFAKTFKSTLIRFSKVNHIDDQLVGFEFQTKMADDPRFFTRFSVDNAANFNPFNLIPIAEHEILMADAKGAKIRFTPEQSLSTFKVQETMGKNPIVVVNGKVIHSDSNTISYETDQGILTVLPSKAMALYGAEAKDGAIVINDPNYTTKVNGKYINTPKTNATTNNTIVAIAFKVRITKNTTDAELETIKKNLKENHSVEIDYSVTRNNNNEITGLKIKYKTAKNNTGNYTVSGDSPIADVFIFEDEDGYTGIGNTGSSAEIRERMEERQALLQERYKQMEELHKERQEEMEVLEEEHKERRRELEERVEKQQEKYKERLEIHEEKMEERQKALEERRAILEEKREEMSEVRQKALKEKRKALEEKRKVLEEKRKEMHKKHLKSAQVVHGYNTNSQRLFITSSPTGIITNANNGGVVTNFVTKETSNAELKNIQASYAEDDIKFSYKGLKRNNQGEIIAITLKLSDKNNKTSATFKNNNEAIPMIYVGYTGNQ